MSVSFGVCSYCHCYSDRNFNNSSWEMCDQCLFKKLRALPFVVPNSALREIGMYIDIAYLSTHKKQHKKGKGRYRYLTYIKGYDGKIYFLRDSIINRVARRLKEQQNG